MNKKILISLATIGAVAAIAVGGTIAYFSDTETSTGNTFTAGELDLRFQYGGAATAWMDVDGNPLFDSEAMQFPNDLKPGDQGEKTVRLWVDDNPACGEITINVYKDYDNTCNEPEIGDEPLCETNPTANEENSGELNDAINFVVWLDEGVTSGFQGPQDLSECDNDLADGIEKVLTYGTLTEDEAYYIGELPTSEAEAACYGIAWCYGTWEGKNCDGSLVTNASQSDSFKADIIINALQKRNRFDNGCPIMGDIR